MLIIGITGGSGSGKTTLVTEILNRFEPGKIAALSSDYFYKDNSHLPPEERKLLNFDHPDSIDFDLFYEGLLQLSQGNAIQAPTYDFITSTRKKETLVINPAQVIIAEGILILSDERIRNLCHLKVFIDAGAKERLQRITKRDMEQRGRTLNEVLERFEAVHQMHEQFVEPVKHFADIIIPNGGENQEAIDKLMHIIKVNIKPR
jgi:uridine kinase